MKMEVNKTLYKQDSKGKIRTLQIKTYKGTLLQKSGLVGGKIVVHESVSKPKNVGRANETTSQEQAISEANSKLLKKLDEGYFETYEEAKIEEVTLPMLAKDFKKESKKIKWPCHIQPKLDGMRALGSAKGGLISRKGKTIDTIKHIDLTSLVGETIDGELYAHGLSFQENMSLVKKYREGESEQIKYHVYDMVGPKDFQTRYGNLLLLAQDMPNVEVVETYLVHNIEQVKVFHKKFIAEGYEGSIIRWGEDGYKVNGRSSNLLKYKDFIDQTYKVVDIEPSDKVPSHGVVICEGVDNSGHRITFGCGMKFSHSERKELLEKKADFIGQTAEVRFFEFTDDGIPRFPVCHGFRFDK